MEDVLDMRAKVVVLYRPCRCHSCDRNMAER